MQKMIYTIDLGFSKEKKSLKSGKKNKTSNLAVSLFQSYLCNKKGSISTNYCGTSRVFMIESGGHKESYQTMKTIFNLKVNLSLSIS